MFTTGVVPQSSKGVGVSRRWSSTANSQIFQNKKNKKNFGGYPTIHYLSTMEDEKYYVPAVEEFHIGFEYEIVEFTSHNGEPRSLKYTKKVLDAKKYGWWDLEGAIKNNNARVKHLDREDIESLGFFCGTTSGVCASYGKRDDKQELRFVLHEQYHNNTIKIERVLYYDAGKETIFEGTIKNKSELKKLLKQLGI